MSPILPNSPEALETERLVLRCGRPADSAAINDAIRETWDDLHQWMPWAVEMPPIEETEARVRQWRTAYMERSEFVFSAWIRESGEFVALCGLHPTRWDVPSLMIGYWCRKRFHGQGYVSEAVRRVARFAFEELAAKRVWICCDPDNDRSRRVAERCGFILEGELRNDSRTPRGELRNTVIYSMIPEEAGRLRG